MKVLKFGGAIVGNAELLKKAKAVIEGEKAPVVVVSAIEGMTDELSKVLDATLEGDTKTALEIIASAKKKHLELVGAVVPSERQGIANEKIERLCGELTDIVKALAIIKDYTEGTEATVIAYGERMMSAVVSAMVDAEELDSTEFICGAEEPYFNEIDVEASASLIEKTFKGKKKTCVCQGFIGTGADGEPCIFERGASDLTATVIASALKAECAEIWKTEYGFLSADPGRISSAYPIDHIGYDEAAVLAHNGVGAIYSDALKPCKESKTPIWVKNICDSEWKGTLISADPMPEDKIIKGIASQDDCVMYTLDDLSFVSLAEITKFANSYLSYYSLLSFSSVNRSMAICIKAENQEVFEAMMRMNFEMELDKVDNIIKSKKSGLASLVIVGENMKRATGTAGKLFNALGRNNINIVALNQDSSETSITCIIDNKDLKKSLNAIHETFFLTEYQELNIFVVGTGTVGGSLLEQLHTQKEMIMKQNSVKLNVIGVADVDHFILNREGVDLTKYNELLKNGQKSTPDTLKQALFDLNAFNCVFVDCTASGAIAAMYPDLLQHNISVVCANKIAASGDYDNYINLKNTARKRGIKYLFETNVGAGLPIINTIGDLIYSGDRIVKLEAVLSGTLNFIFNTISEEIPLSKAIRMAMEARFAEPDPRIDLSGKDVIRKLVILARESGLKVSQEDVEKNLFIPDDFFEGTLDDFWKKVEGFDAEFEEKRKVLAAEGKRWRFVATLDEGKTKVGLQAVDSRHPFYDLEGSNNLIIINTARYKDPMMIRGYGAGAAVTAAGVFADIISIANIR